MHAYSAVRMLQNKINSEEGECIVLVWNIFQLENKMKKK